MGDNYWSQSVCRSDTLWYGFPGQGTYYYTTRFGLYWVGGAVYQIFASRGYECGALGPPVKAYGAISEFGGGEGQWFLGGCIVFRYATQSWTVFYGDYGQVYGRLADEPLDESTFSESPVEESYADPRTTPMGSAPKRPRPPKPE